MRSNEDSRDDLEILIKSSVQKTPESPRDLEEKIWMKIIQEQKRAGLETGHESWEPQWWNIIGPAIAFTLFILGINILWIPKQATLYELAEYAQMIQEDEIGNEWQGSDFLEEQ